MSSAPNGIYLAPKQTENRENWSNCGRETSMPPQWRERKGRGLLLLMLFVLALSLTACATTGTPSDSMPRNPLPPQLSQSPPTKTYSASASELIQSWRKLLTDTLMTP